MGIIDSIARLTEYYSRHGFAATMRRAGLSAKRVLFAKRMVVYYCDLANHTARPVNIPNSMRIDRLCNETELGQQDFQDITSFWNPKQASRNIKERFAKGASLWLIKAEGQVAGYGWTLQGCTVAEYYFPMGAKDVQLFDFYVAPKFRGRAMHWLLTAYILQTLAAGGAARAFADTHEWNQAQISSFKMTPFRQLGLVRSFTLWGRTFVRWIDKKSLEETQKGTVQRDRNTSLARSHEH
jgi:L-amino acid N-acyltransferase YncA